MNIMPSHAKFLACAVLSLLIWPENAHSGVWMPQPGQDRQPVLAVYDIQNVTQITWKSCNGTSAIQTVTNNNNIIQWQWHSAGQTWCAIGLQTDQSEDISRYAKLFVLVDAPPTARITPPEVVLHDLSGNKSNSPVAMTANGNVLSVDLARLRLGSSGANLDLKQIKQVQFDKPFSSATGSLNIKAIYFQ